MFLMYVRVISRFLRNAAIKCCAFSLNWVATLISISFSVSSNLGVCLGTSLIYRCNLDLETPKFGVSSLYNIGDPNYNFYVA